MFYTFLTYFERFLSENIPICVVFDGVKPRNKAMTLSHRRNVDISVTDEVMSTATMLMAGSRQLFTRKVMIEALQFLQRKYSPQHVIVHNALGEADAEVVRIAHHLQAYAVVANDYDFLILLSNTPGIAFIPIDNFSFRGTEYRSYPAWEYQPIQTGAGTDADGWIEFTKEECIRLGAAALSCSDKGNKNKKDFIVSVQLGDVIRSPADERFGYSQFEIRGKPNKAGDKPLTGGSLRYAVRQPNILAVRYDIRDISLGLGLEEASLPAFATLVGSDFLPHPQLRGVHSYIGTLRRQGEKPDVIPAVAALVRQHAEWSQISAAAVRDEGGEGEGEGEEGGKETGVLFPFNESFFARIASSSSQHHGELHSPDATSVVSPADMSKMARAAIGFFSLHRNPEEFLLAAALILSGLFPTFQAGLLETRVVKCLVTHNRVISMPNAMELTGSHYDSNSNDNCYPLMAVVINLLKRLALVHSASSPPENNEVVAGQSNDDMMSIQHAHRELSTVLRLHNMESILEVTRPSRAAQNEGNADTDTVRDREMERKLERKHVRGKLVHIMQRFCASWDLDPSLVLSATPTATPPAQRAPGNNVDHLEVTLARSILFYFVFLSSDLSCSVLFFIIFLFKFLSHFSTNFYLACLSATAATRSSRFVGSSPCPSLGRCAVLLCRPVLAGAAL